MSAELLARFGGAVGALGLAVLILAPGRFPRLAGLGAWGAGMALFVPLLAPSGHDARLVGGAAVGVLVAAALGALFLRVPWALALLALAAVPVRLQVSVGDVSAGLLVPLYAAIAGAAFALAWAFLRERAPASRELGPLAWPTALIVLWFGVSALWAVDIRQASINLFFFYLPFALLAVAVARLPWSARGLAWVYRALVAMALVFAAVGVWQWVTRDIFWNPKVILADSLGPFFRVNSVFWDPSIYGRFLVITMLASLVLLLFRVSPRWELVLGLAIVALWVGLLFSFSQSSFAALVAGTALAAALAWRWRAAVAVAFVAAVMIPVGIAAPQFENVRETLVAPSTNRLNKATGGRFELLENGVGIAVDHPVAGVGVGGYQKAYADRLGRQPRLAGSHNTPVTVAAEGGVIGLGLLAWLVAVALLTAFRGSLPAATLASKVRIVAGVVVAAIFVHSLFYNALFEDPMLWAFVGLTALAARAAGLAALGAEPGHLEAVGGGDEAVRGRDAI